MFTPGGGGKRGLSVVVVVDARDMVQFAGLGRASRHVCTRRTEMQKRMQSIELAMPV